MDQLKWCWDFQFDPNDVGIKEKWYSAHDFNEEITVPFPWGSKLSGQEDLADIGWYQKSIAIPQNWDGRRTFLVIGASDWETQVWIDNQHLGTHQGGYVPFEFELTHHLRSGQIQNITIRVDDKRRSFTLYGKQGYGNARGIWQTVYLESRGSNF